MENERFRLLSLGYIAPNTVEVPKTRADYLKRNLQGSLSYANETWFWGHYVMGSPSQNGIWPEAKLLWRHIDSGHLRDISVVLLYDVYTVWGCMGNGIVHLLFVYLWSFEGILIAHSTNKQTAEVMRTKRLYNVINTALSF